MLRKKSPRAPSMPLDQAIARVQRAYDKQQLGAVPTDAVAQNLGYKGANNGSALSALASLRYYGLLERPKDGHLAVSKDFERFTLAPDAPQRQALLAGFLKQPQLYGQLLEKYKIEGYREPYEALKTQLAAYEKFLRQDVLPVSRTDFKLPPELYAFSLKQKDRT